MTLKRLTRHQMTIISLEYLSRFEGKLQRFLPVWLWCGNLQRTNGTLSARNRNGKERGFYHFPLSCHAENRKKELPRSPERKAFSLGISF
jgi:hypothetical protein